MNEQFKIEYDEEPGELGSGVCSDCNEIVCDDGCANELIRTFGIFRSPMINNLAAKYGLPDVFDGYGLNLKTGELLDYAS